MTYRARSVLSIAILGLSTPALACPGMYSCIPSSCFTMHAAPAAPRDNTLGALNFQYRNMSLLSQVPLAAMGGGAGSSLYAWVDPLTNREYAIMGRSTGTSFVDVTNPSSPVVVANMPRVAGSASTSWREPKVFKNHVYVGVDGTSVGMQVMDLTRLRSYNGTTLTLTEDSVYRGPSNNLTKIHTLAINHSTGYLYAAGSNINAGRLHIIDVNNPGTPTYAGTTGTLDGYVHETQVVNYNGPDARYRGRELAFNNNGPGNILSILDVTNKAAVTKIASRTYAGEQYIHQGWLTEDQRYYFMNDELDEPNNVNTRTKTHLFDVADLTNPIYKGFFTHETRSTDHNLYVKGDYVYQTNYTSGLRILKIGNLQSSTPSDWLSEVAYFDTYTLDDASPSTAMNGAWNNYPYLPSGNILVSDIQGGLFVLKADLPDTGPIPNWYKKYGPGEVLFQSVPEPGSIGLMAVGFVTLALRRQRRH
jgi:choice-of-anchor B domain-containing protein